MDFEKGQVGGIDDDAFKEDEITSEKSKAVDPSAPSNDSKTLYRETDYRPSWNETDYSGNLELDLMGRKPPKYTPPFPNVHRYNYLRGNVGRPISSNGGVGMEYV